ncbi:hypothetical protein [Bacillus cereus]|uniref:hypothetical protein n=1 Tax=Bacillus cereus TaxID=1396 RepID=UPI001BABF2AF|nr:hypothetical protein [Bacillus cereus]MBR9654990.1 hypothetical protein [Bacillus cereus]
MKGKKIIAGALTVSLLSTGFMSTKAAVEEVGNNVATHTAQAPVQALNFNLKTTMENNLLIQSISPSDLKDIEGISEYFNLTPEEKQVFLDAAANKDDSGFETRGKLSWAAKAIKKLWNELPGPVKDRLGRQSALITIANRVEHYTGALEDAIYAGVLDVVGNPTAAWWITKSITLLL